MAVRREQNYGLRHPDRRGRKALCDGSGSSTVQELKLIAKSATPEYANQKYDEYDLDSAYGEQYSVGNLCPDFRRTVLRQRKCHGGKAVDSALYLICGL